MLIATFRLQYCKSSSGKEVDYLHVAICEDQNAPIAVNQHATNGCT